MESTARPTRAPLPVALCALVALGCAGGYAGLAQRGELRRAEIAFAQGHFDTAAQKADAALRRARLEPAVDAEASLLLARSLGRLERRAEAAYVLRYLLTLHPGAPEATEARAELEALAPERGERLPPGPAWPPVFLPLSMRLERPWLRRPALVFFPNAAALERREGRVTVALLVREDGQLDSFELIEASDARYSRAVERALAGFELEPTAFAGGGFPRRKVVTLHFRFAAS